MEWSEPLKGRYAGRVLKPPRRRKLPQHTMCNPATDQQQRTDTNEHREAKHEDAAAIGKLLGRAMCGPAPNDLAGIIWAEASG